MTALPMGRREMLAVTAAVAIAGMARAAQTPNGAPGFLPRHGAPIGLQLYTVADAARADLAGTFARIAAIGYRTVELAGFHGHTPAELRDAADHAGLRLTSIHISASGRNGDPGLDGDPGRLAADLHVLGIGKAILPLFLPPQGMTAQAQRESFLDYLRRAGAAMTADDWRRNAAFLNHTAAALKPHGIALGYHNHNPELRPLAGGHTGLELLLAGTDPRLITFEMDAGWVAAAGLDPVALLARHRGRFTAMHVKDIRASTTPNYAFRQDPCPVGQGGMDWNRLLPAAYRTGIRDFFVEQEPPFVTDRFAAIAQSFAYLSGGTTGGGRPRAGER